MITIVRAFHLQIIIIYNGLDSNSVSLLFYLVMTSTLPFLPSHTPLKLSTSASDSGAGFKSQDTSMALLVWHSAVGL
jgi:hypothetical protein